MGVEVFASTIDTAMSLIAQKINGTFRINSGRKEIHFGTSPLYLYQGTDNNAQFFIANNSAEQMVSSFNLSSTSLCTYTNKSGTVRAVGVGTNTKPSFIVVIAEDTNGEISGMYYYNNVMMITQNNISVFAMSAKGQISSNIATSIFKCPNIITGYMFKDLYFIFSASASGNGLKFSMGGKKYMQFFQNSPLAVEVE